jgi:RNA polymerase sigma-70 factor (ECF subfamily)
MVPITQEQDAIRRCQAGDLDALGIISQLHHQAVFRTAYGYHLAEDVTQQVFVELFTAIKGYDPSRPFPPWLHRIAVRRSLDALRRRKQDVPIDRRPS